MAILSNHALFSRLRRALIILAVLVVQAQSQPGFISIDCGRSDGSTYTDATTGLIYFPDTNFTTSGESRDVAPEYKLKTKIEQFWNVRSFPEGIRNCYTLTPQQGNDTRYLIRARFMYGNYDNRDHIPKFDLYLGIDLWDTINLEVADTMVIEEIILIPLSHTIDVCLVNTGYGVPFISVLEVRPLGRDMYASPIGKALQLSQRFDFGTTSNELAAGNRYKEDAFDRIWFPYTRDPTWTTLNNSLRLQNNIGRSMFEVPMSVLNTAYATTNSSGDNLTFILQPQNITAQYFFYMHFAELEEMDSSRSRNFEIYINGILWSPGPILLDGNFYLGMVTVFTRTFEPVTKPDGQGLFQVWINRTSNSTLPPLINAMENFMVKDISSQTTDDNEATAMMNIKSMYGVSRNWQGDPCSPKAYLWNGLNCNYGASNPLRIISLDLSKSGLIGEISPDIASLKMLQNLDLSNNRLQGKVPEFLGQLSSLKVLNLQGNNFTGPIPDVLIKRSRNGLSISYDKNLNPCPTNSTLCGENNDKSYVIPIVASIVGFIVLLLVATAVLFWQRRRRNRVDMKDREKGSNYPNNNKKQFKYSDIKRITNNFEKILGEGGFGKVYLGYLNGVEVAVKTLSSPSIQAHRQFHAELKLLLTVHHKNLTTLVGFCNDGTNVALIYEYMAKGNLRSHLSSKSTTVLSWEVRLRIAIDTAQGLEYLHNGCKPPIVHRDVKTTNILLTEKFQAKLGDFGLSRIFPIEAQLDDLTSDDVAGVSTIVAGTPGYLDPEYYASNWLNEKSDVYSFGVVLLEIVSGQPVLSRNREHIHLVQLVNSLVEKGDIKEIIDARIEGGYDANTAWKVVELAMACAAPKSTDRPSMNHVAVDLKDCLITEFNLRNEFSDVDSKGSTSVEVVSGSMITEFSPQAR